jgi:hypothetical protein
MFYRIESIGKYGDNFQKLVVIVQKRILSEEFLLYDNDFLDMVLGVSSPSYGDNVFDTGSLYGKRFVYLGTNQTNKPKLKIKNVTDITSAGEIYVWDNNVTLNGAQLTPNKNSSYLNFKLNNNGALVKPGAGDFVVRNNKDINKNFEKNGKGVLKDANNGGSLQILNFDEIFPHFAIKAKTGGIFITSGAGGGSVGKTDPDFKNPYTTIGKPTDLIFLDFEKFGDGDSELGSIPSNFNGIIYSMVPLRIKGNPDVDTVIVCEKDIYMCGDFNQSEKVIQSYKTKDLLDYLPNPVNNLDYFKEDKDFRVNNPTKKHGLYRNRCKIISKQKIWYDYTRPDYIFKNELLPYIEFELSILLTKKSRAYNMMKDLKGIANLTPNGPSQLLKKIEMDSTTLTDDEILEKSYMNNFLKYFHQKPTVHKSNSGASRVNSVYADFYGKDKTCAIDFVKTKIKFTETDGSDVEASIIEMLKDGKVTPGNASNIYDLDDKLASRVPAPRLIKSYHIGVPYLNLRDSNLSPDFPTDAQIFLEQFLLLSFLVRWLLILLLLCQ